MDANALYIIGNFGGFLSFLLFVLSFFLKRSINTALDDIANLKNDSIKTSLEIALQSQTITHIKETQSIEIRRLSDSINGMGIKFGAELGQVKETLNQKIESLEKNIGDKIDMLKDAIESGKKP